MKAMIFAAGLGSRLRPLTLDRPKALVEAAGVTMLERTMRSLQRAGVTEVVVNAHHFAPMVAGFVERCPVDGLRCRVSREDDLLLDTGGGVLRAASMLTGDGPVIIHNVDILTDASLVDMMEAHRKSGADVTLMAFGRPSSRRLLFDADGRLRGWMRTDTGETLPRGLDTDGLTPLAFGGVHIMGERAFAELERYGADSEEAFGIVPFYIAASDSLDIRAWRPDGEFSWFDIGTPQRLADAEKWLRR